MFAAYIPPATCNALPSGTTVAVFIAVERTFVMPLICNWFAKDDVLATFSCPPMVAFWPIPRPPGVTIAPVVVLVD